MVRSNIVSVRDCNSLGLDKLPARSLVFNKATGDIFKLTSVGSQDTVDILGDSSCKALFKFDGNILDSSGNYVASAANITYTSGEFGQAVVGNGTSSYIQIPYALNNFDSNTFSLSIWVYTLNRFSFGVIGSTASSNPQFQPVVGLNVDGRIYTGNWTYGDSAQGPQVVGTSQAVLNAWNHIVLVKKSAGVYSIYLNGVLDASLDSFTVTNGTGSVNIQLLRAWIYSSYGYSDSILEQFRIFNKPLSQAEVDILLREDIKNVKFCNIQTKTLVLSNGRLLGKAMFYAGHNTAVSSYSNKTDVFDSTGTLTQTEGSVGTARTMLTGVNAGSNALYYGGGSGSDGTYGTTTNNNTATILTPTATLLQSELNVGTARYLMGGAKISNVALYYGGYISGGITCRTTILSQTASLVQAEINSGVTSDPYSSSGVSVNVNTNALFYRIYTNVMTNTAKLINGLGVILSTQAVAGASALGYYPNNGTNAHTNAMYYGGADNTQVNHNTVTIVTPSMTLAQAETDVGTTRYMISGANVGENSCYYGSSTVTMLTPTATMLQIETNSIGTSRTAMGGASI